MSNLDFIFEIENYYNFKFKTKDLEKANSIRFFVTYLKGKIVKLLTKKRSQVFKIHKLKKMI